MSYGVFIHITPIFFITRALGNTPHVLTCCCSMPPRGKNYGRSSSRLLPGNMEESGYEDSSLDRHQFDVLVR